MPSFPRIEPLGESAFLVRFADRLDDAANRACIAFRAGLEADPVDGVRETASSLGSVLVRFDGDGRGIEADLDARLHARDWATVPPPPCRRWRIPCAFGGADGPQLDAAAALAGLDAGAAVAALCAAETRVLALGFAPGMPYLGRLDAIWDIPRQTDLTPRVPQGALCLAVRQMVLFGVAAPTGWRQVGRTAFRCFDAGRARPVALQPGDTVRLEAVAPDALAALAARDEDGHGGATWEAVG